MYICILCTNVSSSCRYSSCQNWKCNGCYQTYQRTQRYKAYCCIHAVDWKKNRLLHFDTIGIYKETEVHNFKFLGLTSKEKQWGMSVSSHHVTFIRVTTYFPIIWTLRFKGLTYFLLYPGFWTKNVGPRNFIQDYLM